MQIVYRVFEQQVAGNSNVIREGTFFLGGGGGGLANFGIFSKRKCWPSLMF